jgi:hypothetical protein
MRKLIPAFLLGAGMLFMTSGAQAFPVAPDVSHSSNVIRVAGGCGIGWHRGPWGGCRPNYYYAGRSYPRCWWRPTPWGPRRVCVW